MTSANPRLRQAGAVFVGGNRFTSPFAWIRVLPMWRALLGRLDQLPGYLGHRVYWRPPFTLGIIAFFADWDSLLISGRIKAHRDLMVWVEEHANGGWIRLYDKPSGQEPPT
jgi:hypothetical protein